MKTMQRALRFYRVEYIGSTWTLPADLLGNARVASMMAAAREWDLPIAITVETRTETVRVCSWCRARPCAWDWDCDGRYELVECEDRQCRGARLAAYEGEIAPPSYVAARPARLRQMLDAA